MPPFGHLRPISGTDVTQAYVDGLNDPVVHEFLEAARLNRQSIETVTDYVEANRSDPNAILFGVFVNDVLRGTVRLHEIDVVPESGIMGIALFDRSIWGRNIGSSAIIAGAEFATEMLGIGQTVALLYAANRGSSRAFEKAGFRRTAPAVAALDKKAVESWIFEAPAKRAAHA